tara:strand:- start:5887 stop:6399 length:513 start_codon:yes stop_codon:yes gene_type:complete
LIQLAEYILGIPSIILELSEQIEKIHSHSSSESREFRTKMQYLTLQEILASSLSPLPHPPVPPLGATSLPYNTWNYGGNTLIAGVNISQVLQSVSEMTSGWMLEHGSGVTLILAADSHSSHIRIMSTPKPLIKKLTDESTTIWYGLAHEASIGSILERMSEKITPQDPKL